jgi:hypothetical protein
LEELQLGEHHLDFAFCGRMDLNPIDDLLLLETGRTETDGVIPLALVRANRLEPTLDVDAPLDSSRRGGVDTVPIDFMQCP